MPVNPNEAPAGYTAQALADALRKAIELDDIPWSCVESTSELLIRTQIQCAAEKMRQALAAFERAKAEPVRVTLPQRLELFCYFGQPGDDLEPHDLGRYLKVADIIAALKAQGIEVAE